MQSDFSFLDIIFLIVMAIFIATRFMGNNLPKEVKKSKNIIDFPEDKLPQEIKELKKQISKKKIEDLSGIEKIKAADKNFNEKEFIAGGELAYAMYYEALNDRDEETLEGMLAPRKFDEIMESIESLEDENKQRYVTVSSITSLEILEARLHGRTVIIEVKYTAKQKDSIEKLKAVKSSAKVKEKEISTVWAWARNIDSEDLNWELESISLLS